jgi:hypothetical protein
VILHRRNELVAKRAIPGPEIYVTLTLYPFGENLTMMLNSPICSMSDTGNCYDNACAESFFHALKVEAIHGERSDTREKIRRVVFEYIEVDFSRIRRHSTNGKMRPVAFEAKRLA